MYKTMVNSLIISIYFKTGIKMKKVIVIKYLLIKKIQTGYESIAEKQDATETGRKAQVHGQKWLEVVFESHGRELPDRTPKGITCPGT